MILLLFNNCINKDENYILLNSLDDYVKEFPVFFVQEIDSLGVKKDITCIYPVYEVYFEKGDKIIKIKRTVLYKDSIKNTRLKKFFFLYRDKYPILIYKHSNYIEKSILKLQTKIPDTLFFEFGNCDMEQLYLGSKTKIYNNY